MATAEKTDDAPPPIDATLHAFKTPRGTKMILTQRKWWIILCMCASALFVLNMQGNDTRAFSDSPYMATLVTYETQVPDEDMPDPATWRNLSDVEVANLSTLGRILFLEEQPPEANDSQKTYQILIWKYGPAIEPRHLKRFTNNTYDPFEHCSAKNCKLTYRSEDLNSSDIVIIHMHRTQSVSEIPQHANERQIFAFLTDESPYHMFMGRGRPIKLSLFNGLFNWSMNYRMDADIPVPYGRTVVRKFPLRSVGQPWEHKRRDVLVAALGSDCSSKNQRWQYVKELQNYLKVDFYGKCGTLKCPGNFKKDCPLIDSYVFYLAFENSNCREYYTEKVWWNAYHKNSIPIVMGHPKDYKKLMPPGSFLNTAEFAKPADLAEYILYMNRTNDFSKFYTWKRKYKVLNEHGYFQSESFHYCRVCEALNYNSRAQKVYNDLENFWSVRRDCTPSWNDKKVNW